MSTILLIEENPGDRALVHEILIGAGFVVYDQPDARQACQRAREIRPQAVILDACLAEGLCAIVCRELKADPTLASTPVLILTTHEGELDTQAGLDAGADDYVTRDALSQILLARLQRLVHVRQMTLAAALNQQLAQVGRLVAGIIHEIRGPLSVVRGNAEVIRSLPDVSEQTLTYLDPLLRNVQILQMRLDHLMATVRGGKIRLEPTDLAPVVREVADLFLKSTDPKRGRLRLEVEIPDDLPRVEADPGRLIQVFMSLLGNAYDATQARSGEGEGYIHIQAQVGVESPGAGDSREWVVVDVSDNGPGIPEPILTRVFEPFFTTKLDGSGYGLYLASEILREHDGRLTASNDTRTGGARFRVWLPVKPRPSE